MLTSGTMIIAHYYQASFEGHVFREGRVSIGDGVFLGARSMVVADIEVGDRSVVAAGAVVTRDVNSGAIVAGIPAKEVGKREGRSPDNELPTLTDYLRNRHR